jgi:hypothetical protein
MAKSFDAETLAALHNAKEVRIRTSRHKNRGVVIWIVVADGASFVRSVQGPAGKWYTTAAADGQATLEVGDQRVPVHAARVEDPATIEAVSRAFLSKYATSPYAPSIVRPDTLPTTLRLDPV